MIIIEWFEVCWTYFELLNRNILFVKRINISLYFIIIFILLYYINLITRDILDIPLATFKVHFPVTKSFRYTFKIFPKYFVIFLK